MGSVVVERLLQARLKGSVLIEEMVVRGPAAVHCTRKVAVGCERDPGRLDPRSLRALFLFNQ